MNYLEQAIKDAQKAGWKYQGEHSVYIPEYIRAPGIAQFPLDGIDFLITKEQALLDPAFWSALGKARGWEYGDYVGFKEQSGLWEGERWFYEWLGLIHSIASGGTIEGFFKWSLGERILSRPNYRTLPMTTTLEQLQARARERLNIECCTVPMCDSCEYQGQMSDSIVAEAFRAGQEEVLAPQAVGMLRQWLNEDRITDHTKLVSNEDLLDFIRAALKSNTAQPDSLARLP